MGYSLEVLPVDLYMLRESPVFVAGHLGLMRVGEITSNPDGSRQYAHDEISSFRCYAVKGGGQSRQVNPGESVMLHSTRQLRFVNGEGQAVATIYNGD